MNKLSTNGTPKQLGFADIPLPLIAAQEYGFPLQHYAPTDDNQEYLYSVQDWITGVTGKDSARQVWANLKRRYDPAKIDPAKRTGITKEIAERFQKQLLESVIQLGYAASNGRTYQMDFCNAETLYMIAQLIDADTGLKMGITAYLAESGAKMDEWRLNPEKMLSAAQSAMQFDIARHEKAGLGDRPEIVHLKSEFEISKSLKLVNDWIAKIVDNPDYARLHNAKLEALFGYKSKQIKAILNCKDIHKGLPTMQLDTLDFAHKQIVQIFQMQATGKISMERAADSIEMVVMPLGKYLQGLCDTLGIDAVTGQAILPSGKGR